VVDAQGEKKGPMGKNGGGESRLSKTTGWGSENKPRRRGLGRVIPSQNSVKECREGEMREGRDPQKKSR